ncbi:transporter substrate-binding domain-containing protein [Aestuariibacter halophilus]|uniref:Transporter substrate-binding domain-containing protein n=2 Tax=Fluctibacter halophilus TaxID=226011 RepID=A0ABS8GBK9_9ALTE|nr:transporter substrate-binding domain-containing protein [Aestuariibacter halophilus]
MNQRWRGPLLTGLIMCFYSWAVHASQPLRVAVNAPGSYPYLFFAPENGQYQGVIPDFLAAVFNPKGIEIEYLDSNQLRSEQLLHSDEVSFYLANPKWLKNTTGLLISEPLASHKTFLYSLRPFPSGFSLRSLAGSRICARQEFVYTGLTDSFAQADIERVDSSSQSIMADMLVGQRCDYAVLNNYNAMDVFSPPKHCHLRVFESPWPTSTVTLHLIMSASMAETKPVVDAAIREFRTSGQLNRIIAAYTGSRTFQTDGRCR